MRGPQWGCHAPAIRNEVRPLVLHRGTILRQQLKLHLCVSLICSHLGNQMKRRNRLDQGHTAHALHGAFRSCFKRPGCDTHVLHMHRWGARTRGADTCAKQSGAWIAHLLNHVIHPGDRLVVVRASEAGLTVVHSHAHVARDLVADCRETLLASACALQPSWAPVPRHVHAFDGTGGTREAVHCKQPLRLFDVRRWNLLPSVLDVSR